MPEIYKQLLELKKFHLKHKFYPKVKSSLVKQDPRENEKKNAEALWRFIKKKKLTKDLKKITIKDYAALIIWLKRLSDRETQSELLEEFCLFTLLSINRGDKGIEISSLDKWQLPVTQTCSNKKEALIFIVDLLSMDYNATFKTSLFNYLIPIWDD